MATYFAYHAKENKEVYSVEMGYGFPNMIKVNKVNLGDKVYIFQKIHGWEHFELCGRFEVTGKYTDTTSDRPYRLRLKDDSKLSEPIRIDEDEWSDALPERVNKLKRNNFQKHFCQQNESCQRELTRDVIDVIERYLRGNIVDSTSDDLLDITSTDLSETEKHQLIKSRLGQGKFKSNVKKFWNSECCAVTLCGISELLVASHIKAWSKCENSDERLDGANGLLLCSHVDKLFDSHLITFKKMASGYTLVLSPKLNARELSAMGIDSGYSLNHSHLTFEQEQRFSQYMSHHNEIFDKRKALG